MERNHDTATSTDLAVEGSRVSGLLQVPRKARVCYVLAHGAGVGMLHPFMEATAEGLAERGIGESRNAGRIGRLAETNV